MRKPGPMLTEYCRQNGLDPMAELAGIEARRRRDEIEWRQIALSLEPKAPQPAPLPTVSVKELRRDDWVPQGMVKMGPLLLSLLRSHGNVTSNNGDLHIIPNRAIKGELMELAKTHKAKILKEIEREQIVENRNGHHAVNGKPVGAARPGSQASRADVASG